MPHLPIRRPDLGSYISEGQEKTVYHHKDRDDYVIKENKDLIEQTPEQRELFHILAGMEFYLTKIVHLLHPDHMPNIHMATTEHDRLQTIHDKVSNIPTPQYFDSTFLNKIHRHIINMLKRVVDPNPDHTKIKSDLSNIGVHIDGNNTFNFGSTHDGTTTYLDSPYFKPYTKDTGNIRHIIETDVAKLDAAIEAMDDQRKQKSARSYFGRFLALLDVYEQNHMKTNTYC